MTHGNNDAIPLHATMLSNGGRLSLVIDREGGVGFRLRLTSGEVAITAEQATAILLMDRSAK